MTLTYRERSQEHCERYDREKMKVGGNIWFTEKKYIIEIMGGKQISFMTKVIMFPFIMWSDLGLLFLLKKF